MMQIRWVDKRNIKIQSHIFINKNTTKYNYMSVLVAALPQPIGFRTSPAEWVSYMSYCLQASCREIMSTVQYGTVRYSTLHYSTVHYSTLHYSTLHYITVRYSTFISFVVSPCRRRSSYAVCLPRSNSSHYRGPVVKIHGIIYWNRWMT